MSHNPEVVLPETGRSRRRSLKSGFFHYCPLYLYLLAFFIAAEVAVGRFGISVRTPLISYGNYAISLVEIFYLLGALLGIFEMLKVSEPRVDNIWEALAILGAGVIYLILFVLGSTGATIGMVTFEIFNNTEFLMLTLLSAFQVVAAFILNARTLQVQVSNQ